MASRKGRAGPASRIEVYLEVGSQQTVASAVEWPGWTRAAADRERALGALLAYAGRYQPIAASAGLKFPKAPKLEVVECVTGDATTDEGIPGQIAEVDRRPVTHGDAARLGSILEAAWRAFDVAAKNAPSGADRAAAGGRDRDGIVAHVLEAEVAYARNLDVRPRQPNVDDAIAIAFYRGKIVEALGATATFDALGSGSPWPERYAVRRIAWHLVDHLWELEDLASSS